MKAFRKSRLIAGCALVGGVMVTGAAPAFADGGHQGHDGGSDGQTLYVSNSVQGHQGDHRHVHGDWDGHGQWDNHGQWGCSNAQYSTIQAAVKAAPPWATVIVCPGTYAEDVSIPQPLSLVGLHATINAAGLPNGILITGSHVDVKGFTVTGALGEGIVAEPPGVLVNPAPPSDPSQVLTPIADVSIEHNVVNANNTGGDPVTHQCSETPGPPFFLYPGDCGGGIHFNAVAHSEVEGNVVTGNDDGILLTDDYGPNFGNVVANNYVAHNLYECGIVLPSHNPFAVTATQNPDSTYTVGALTPSTGGVFDNVVTNNVAIDNGSVVVPPFGGSGSGIGIFAPLPGSAAYDNTVAHNYVTGSGQSGFTIHAHYGGGEYVSGNKVVGNVFGTNNIGGDGLDGPGTDPDFVRTGILVFSAEPVSMVIAGNHIHGNQIGIWLSADVQASGLPSNSISGATTPVYVSQVPYAFTGPALATAAPTATVGVLIVPNGVATTYYVEYGTTASYELGNTPTASAGSGIGPEGIPVNLPGLTAGQTYHYQVVATNANGTRSGGDQTFTAT